MADRTLTASRFPMAACASYPRRAVIVEEYRVKLKDEEWSFGPDRT